MTEWFFFNVLLISQGTIDRFFFKTNQLEVAVTYEWMQFDMDPRYGEPKLWLSSLVVVGDWIKGRHWGFTKVNSCFCWWLTSQSFVCGMSKMSMIFSLLSYSRKEKCTCTQSNNFDLFSKEIFKNDLLLTVIFNALQHTVGYWALPVTLFLDNGF